MACWHNNMVLLGMVKKQTPQYNENRLKMLDSLRSAGVDPYPHKFEVAISITDYVAKYSSLGTGEHLLTVTESLAGRVMSKRVSSSKLFFYDLPTQPHLSTASHALCFHPRLLAVAPHCHTMAPLAQSLGATQHRGHPAASDPGMVAGDGFDVEAFGRLNVVAKKISGKEILRCNLNMMVIDDVRADAADEDAHPRPQLCPLDG